jgi:glycosyltransferase involved in cell wall biosynthesis
MDLSKVSVVLPSLDPDEKLIAVIDGLLEYGFKDIILVNDGSKPENMHYFETAATHPEVHLLHHEVNKGKGAALKNAFHWFLENRPDSLGVVTVDGDNQHHPEDTKACVEKMAETGRIVLGCRDFSLPHVPARSKFGNNFTCGVFRFFVGMRISDTQTGLRAFPRDVLSTMCAISGDRFEYETNMLLAMKEQGLIHEEVKIRTVYIEENKSSHFRTFRDSWRIYKLILRHFFRYTLSSLVSATVETVLVFLLTSVLPSTLPGFVLTLIPAATGRAVSSLLNFFLNKKLVFSSRCSTGKALLRYYVLVVPMLVVQTLMTHGVFTLFSIDESTPFLRTAIHTAVMVVLFIVSYFIQKRWVFTPNRKKKD